jgi:hypothetical protein
MIVRSSRKVAARFAARSRLSRRFMSVKKDVRIRLDVLTGRALGSPVIALGGVSRNLVKRSAWTSLSGRDSRDC